LIRRFVSRPKKAGVTPAFFVRMTARLRLVYLAAQFEYAKKFFALHATFRHDPLL